MSTDWGYGCETCGRNEHGYPAAMHRITNCRDPAMLTRILAVRHLDETLAALQAIDTSLGIGWDSLDEIRTALSFVAEHRTKGHIVRVVNEYGRWDDQCREYVRCGECGRNHDCVLTAGHDGRCRLRVEPGA